MPDQPTPVPPGSSGPTEEEIEALLKQYGGKAGTPAPAPAASPEAAPVGFPPLASPPATREKVEQQLDLLLDIPLKVRVELGRCKMAIQDVLELARGSVVELEKLAGDPLDIYVNDRLVARGEVLVVDQNFCVRITDIVDAGRRAVGGKP